MLSFLYNLKGEVTVLNGLAVLLILAYIFSRYKKKKLAIGILSVTILLFLSFSTAYLPNYLVSKLESRYLPVQLPLMNLDTGKVLIHVLGSGVVLDKRLPANAQLGWCALGRLAEAIRIHRSIKNSVIICSGYSSLGLETQAQVTKRAAIVLGVDPNNLETLNEPATTQEEAKALARRYDKNCKLVIVSDAIHMPRAIKLFKAEGFNPIAAPTNYKVNEGPDEYGMKWWPSLEKIGLMNYVIHEWLGDLKVSIFG
jgi:uncharacterized SAM-binding protein YcdF (DUF218 family)